MTWIYRTILILVFGTGAYSQCVVPPGFVCLTQAQADKASTLADKYTALKDAFDAATKQIATMQISSDTKDALIGKLREVIAISDQKDAAQAKYNALRDAIDKLRDDYEKQLEKKAANNKSFLQKLLLKLQVAYYILSGIAIVAK